MQHIPELCGPRRDGRYYVTDPATRRPLYLGTDPEQARQRYESWRALFLSRKQSPARPSGIVGPKQGKDALTVARLSELYLEHAEGYYRKRGRPTSEVMSIRDALGCLTGLSHVLATQFTPGRLREVRNLMIADRDWARKHINNQVARIRRMFGWAVEEELLPVEVHAALLRVKGLGKGRSDAREGRKIGPVEWALVERTLPHLRPRVRALVLLQWHSGMRAEEAVAIRPCDIDRSSVPWLYRVHDDWNKTDHLEKAREIRLGPRARAVLGPLLDACRQPDDWVFWSCGRGKNHRYRGHMTPAGYRLAVGAACRKARVAHWFPLQLRHAALTRIRASYGLEGAASVGGHSELETTQIYAEKDRELAARVAEEMG